MALVDMLVLVVVEGLVTPVAALINGQIVACLHRTFTDANNMTSWWQKDQSPPLETPGLKSTPARNPSRISTAFPFIGSLKNEPNHWFPRDVHDVTKPALRSRCKALPTENLRAAAGLTPNDDAFRYLFWSADHYGQLLTRAKDRHLPFFLSI
ncbi:hypothetical protein CIHG_07242 [Coccidioides immitis H538.4]|uniref:Uncharacterized protein n=1 Tax=Coccidioides immitis H538.4 TaxID=396776 RepID=A0A0J8RW97_COCIT|nr:hypothetical protein CIHG_07242 [Coccidioides immitis H538.4]